MGEAIGLSADEADGGVEKGSHGLAAAGDAGDEAVFGIFHDAAHLFQDKGGRDFVVLGGDDVL